MISLFQQCVFKIAEISQERYVFVLVKLRSSWFRLDLLLWHLVLIVEGLSSFSTFVLFGCSQSIWPWHFNLYYKDSGNHSFLWFFFCILPYHISSIRKRVNKILEIVLTYIIIDRHRVCSNLNSVLIFLFLNYFRSKDWYSRQFYNISGVLIVVLIVNL